MIDDQILILYGYGDELDEREQAKVAAAIDADPALAARWRRLQAELDALQDMAICAAPELSKARWRRALDGAAAVESNAARPAAASGARLWWLTGLAAALLVGLGLRLARPPANVALPPGQIASAVPGPKPAHVAQARRGALTPPVVPVRGLNAYLQQGRDDLLMLTEVGGAAPVAERAALVGEILARTRVYQRAAVAQGSPELARVLRAFEQSLAGLADEQTASRDLRADAEQLSFEFTAMLTRLNRAASEQETTL